MRRARAFPRAALLVLSALATSGCGVEETTYSYFLISATIDQSVDDDTLLMRLGKCAVEATTSIRIEGRDLPCHRGERKLGEAQFTTNLTAGSVKFSVILTDINLRQLARGDSAPIGIAPGKTVPVSIVVKSTEPQPDGGVPGG